MKEPTSIYINQLELLRKDLGIIMGTWPHGSSFEAAKKYAETIAPLIAGQIQKLQNAPILLNPADPMKLRSELEKLCDLMIEESEKKKFTEYINMLNSLIKDNIT